VRPNTSRSYPAGRDDQAIIVMPGQDLSERRDQVFEALVRRDPAEEENCLIGLTHAQLPFCLARRETRVRNGIIDSEGDHRNPASSHAKLVDQLTLHFFRVHEDMVRQPVLSPQSKSIEASILGISPVRIHVVRREHDLLPQQLVIKHEHSSIEGLEFVVPEDMKNPGLGCRSVANQLGIIDPHPEDLFHEADIRPLTAA
jgi:hypothetical protein